MQSDSILERAVKLMIAAGNPHCILLFGSRARGDAHADSDYDFLVIESSDVPRYKRAARYRRALVGLCPAKDIVVWTPEEIAEWRNVREAFISTIIREGKVLYERIH